jgi:hypothetical protein
MGFEVDFGVATIRHPDRILEIARHREFSL